MNPPPSKTTALVALVDPMLLRGPRSNPSRCFFLINSLVLMITGRLIGAGSSKLVGAIPFIACFIYAPQVAAGMVPPATLPTPRMLRSGRGRSLYPIHTAVDSVGV